MSSPNNDLATVLANATTRWLGGIVVGGLSCVLATWAMYGQDSTALPSFFVAHTATVSTETTAKNEHLVSPRMSAIIMSGLPKLDATKPAADIDRTVMVNYFASGESDHDVVSLPNYVVRTNLLPRLDRKDEEEKAMKQYLGTSNGFDRGVLNRFTLTQLWREIPVFGRIPFVPFGSVSNEDRAMALRGEDDRLLAIGDFNFLLVGARKSGDLSTGAKLKRDMERAFLISIGAPKPK
ncbi:MAG TPA: hypothetical protein VKC60_10335 [Opitutaceae bacterium]|nr:hypothetical protein [Opitutaceae bacterium]